MRPIDTMPKEGRFIASLYRDRFTGAHEWETVCVEDGVIVGNDGDVIDPSGIYGWEPIPDADSRVVTRAELEKPISAAIRFGSCSEDAMPKFQAALDSAKKSVGWVIVGGESGTGARPCDVEWIRSIVRQCKTAEVPVFVKQLGSLATDPPSVSPLLNEATACAEREAVASSGSHLRRWLEPAAAPLGTSNIHRKTHR